MAKSVEARLQEMEDREAIRELPLKYCDLVWKKDVPAIVNLFTEDGEFDAGVAVSPADRMGAGKIARSDAHGILRAAGLSHRRRLDHVLSPRAAREPEDSARRAPSSGRDQL